MNKKKINILILTLVLVFSANIALSIIQPELVNYSHKADKVDGLNSATTYVSTIIIDDTSVSNTWEDQKAAGVCTGTGTVGDPYRSEHDSSYQDDHISNCNPPEHDVFTSVIPG